MLKIFIDADGCPVKDETYRVAARYQLHVYVVANKPLHIPLHPTLEMVVVGRELDAADNWIAQAISEKDIAITADLPLAHRCLTKGAFVLSPRGEEFTEENIGELLGNRELFSYLRDMGEIKGGPAPMSKKDRSYFLSQLDCVIQRRIRKTS